jgi:N utilization substance protein A|tara:strand:- start:873 stop:1298 length:426 start_codon:yes stop_codon:yes gene_type:complete
MIKLDTETLGFIAALENASGAQVKDCMVTDTEIIYIVNEDKLGQAIGKNGIHVNKIKNALGKPVKIIGFNQDAVKFAKNLLGYVEPKSVILHENETEKHIIIESDYKTHSSILGKRGKKLKILKDLLKRHHNVDNVILRQI